MEGFKFLLPAMFVCAEESSLLLDQPGHRTALGQHVHC